MFGGFGESAGGSRGHLVCSICEIIGEVGLVPLKKAQQLGR